MEVGIRVGPIISVVGPPPVLHAFFSTISANLEHEEWGSRYPELMNELFQGHLDHAKANKVLHDLTEIESQLKTLSRSNAVWDFDNPNAVSLPQYINRHAKDLSTYFITSTNRDLLTVLLDQLKQSVQYGEDVRIVTIRLPGNQPVEE